MPITLGDHAAPRPKWSKTILGLHWFFQFITLGIFQLITIFLVWALFASDSNAGNAPKPASRWLLYCTVLNLMRICSANITASTITMIFILLSNATILCTILYEWGSTFVPQRYFKIQIVKSLYFFFVVVLMLSTGMSLPMEGHSSGVAWVWGMLWRMVIFAGPFWSSLIYAVIIKKRVSNEFGEGGEVAL